MKTKELNEIIEIIKKQPLNKIKATKIYEYKPICIRRTDLSAESEPLTLNIKALSKIVFDIKL